MDIFGIFTMIGGLALFLYGMETMGDGLVMRPWATDWSCSPEASWRRSSRS